MAQAHQQEAIGYDYNNPGALRLSNKEWGYPNGKRGQGHGIQGYTVFPSAEIGFMHQCRLLQKKYNNKTPLQIFSKYAPQNDPTAKNNPTRYAQAFCKGMRAAGYNITPNTKLNLNDPNILAETMYQIARQECGSFRHGPNKGKPYFSREFVKKQAEHYLSVCSLTGGTDWLKASNVDQYINIQNMASNTSLPVANESNTLQSMPTELPVLKSVSPQEMPLVQAYYNRVKENGYLSRLAPKRVLESRRGVINENNIPKGKDPFEVQAFHAMAKTESAILKNIQFTPEQQTQLAIATAGKALSGELKNSNAKAIQLMEDITLAAAKEIQIRHLGRALSNAEEAAITAQSKEALKGITDEQFLARCDKTLADSNHFVPQTEMPLIKDYYNRVAKLGYLAPKTAPIRCSEAAKGIINDENIPHAKDSFEYHSLQAIAKTESAIRNNSDLSVEQQTQLAIATAGKALEGELKSNNPKAVQMVEDIALAASKEVQIRHLGRPLNATEEAAITAQSQGLFKDLSGDQLLAQCDKMLAPSTENILKPESAKNTGLASNAQLKNSLSKHSDIDSSEWINNLVFSSNIETQSTNLKDFLMKSQQDTITLADINYPNNQMGLFTQKNTSK